MRKRLALSDLAVLILVAMPGLSDYWPWRWSRWCEERRSSVYGH